MIKKKNIVLDYKALKVGGNKYGQIVEIKSIDSHTSIV
jgi:hypothetical protein